MNKSLLTVLSALALSSCAGHAVAGSLPSLARPAVTQLLVHVTPEALRDCSELDVRLTNLDTGQTTSWQPSSQAPTTPGGAAERRYQASGGVQVVTRCRTPAHQDLGSSQDVFYGPGVLLIRSPLGQEHALLFGGH